MWPQPLRIESISLHGNQSTETLATKAHWGMQFRHNYVKHVNCSQEGNEMSTGKKQYAFAGHTHTYKNICICILYVYVINTFSVCVYVCVKWRPNKRNSSLVSSFLSDLTKGYLFFYVKAVLLGVGGAGELHLWQTMINALATFSVMDGCCCAHLACCILLCLKCRLSLTKWKTNSN